MGGGIFLPFSKKKSQIFKKRFFFLAYMLQ